MQAFHDDSVRSIDTIPANSSSRKVQGSVPQLLGQIAKGCLLGAVHADKRAVAAKHFYRNR